MPSYVGPIHSRNDGFSISWCDVTMFSWFVLYTSTASPTSTAILVHFLRKIPLNLKLMAGSLKGYNQTLWKVIECYKTCLDCKCHLNNNFMLFTFDFFDNYLSPLTYSSKFFVDRMMTYKYVLIRISSRFLLQIYCCILLLNAISYSRHLGGQLGDLHFMAIEYQIIQILCQAGLFFIIFRRSYGALFVVIICLDKGLWWLIISHLVCACDHLPQNPWNAMLI